MQTLSALTFVPATVPPLVEDMSPCGSLSVNPYKACDIRCAYCITGAQGVSTPRYPPEVILRQLHDELASKGHLHSNVSLGSLCDAYPSVEADLGLTRTVLTELLRMGRPVTVITKGLTVRRDIDLLRPRPNRVTVSLSSVDDQAIRHLEPNASSPTERLELIHDLADADVQVEVSMTPWIPDVSDAEALIRRVDPAIPIVIAPLNVTKPEVTRTGYGRRYRQRDLNEAYLREHQRVGSHPNVQWLNPVAVDDAAEAGHPFGVLDRAELQPWRAERHD